MPDAHKNFAVSTVATAPSPASSGTSLVVASGHGTRFPTPPFNATVWPAGAQPDPSNAEIVRVTAISTDTLTITRAQEGTSARTIVVGDQIAATITAKTLTDVESVPRAIPFYVGPAEKALNNMPAADQEQFAAAVDFTGCTEVRLIFNMSTFGGSTGSQLRLTHAVMPANDAAYATTQTDLGCSASLVLSGTFKARDSGWVSIPSAQRTEGILRVISSGGDGVADPRIASYLTVLYR